MRELRRELPASTMDGPKEGPSYKVEHVGNFDVIFNLGYPLDSKKRESWLKALKEADSVEDLAEAMKFHFGMSNRDAQFFMKEKGKSQPHVNFILGRTYNDPLHESVRRSFSQEARYALESVLNEIVLSKDIKKMVATIPFQQLAKLYGFSELIFAEPIMAVVDRKSKQKYLLYENIQGTPTEYLDDRSTKLSRDLFTEIATDLRRLFMSNGIMPTDLRSSQFIVSGKGRKKYLYLIDIEAYTKPLSSANE